MIPADTGKLIQQYFRSKTDQLLAVSKLAVCEHGGLKGNHREDLIKLYLNEIMPKRFEIGQGMIYGPISRSSETDIVIWDSYNFPSLKMYGHAMYFAESVQAAIEVKSNYNSNTRDDVVKKNLMLKSIWSNHRETLDSRLFHIEQQLRGIQEGIQYEGFLSSSQTITSCAVFIHGGKNFDLKELELYEELEIEWSDIVLFLEEGKVTVKCIDENGKSFIRLYCAGKDALLLFTKYLIEILSEQVVLVEGMLYFDEYIMRELDDISYEEFEYCPGRPIRGFRHSIFSGE